MEKKVYILKIKICGGENIIIISIAIHIVNKKNKTHSN